MQNLTTRPGDKLGAARKRITNDLATLIPARGARFRLRHGRGGLSAANRRSARAEGAGGHRGRHGAAYGLKAKARGSVTLIAGPSTHNSAYGGKTEYSVSAWQVGPANPSPPYPSL